MSVIRIVQFVCFETTLDSDQFINKWEQYTRSANSNTNVTLQQSEKNGVFRYIAQHRFSNGDFNFTFTKAKRSSRIPEVGIREKQVGGYSALQLNRNGGAHADECKVFAFITDTQTDLAVYRELCAKSNLNIYEAYYENCQYAYILEFFVKKTAAAEFAEELTRQHVAETGIYKERMLQTA
ncbi:MAG: hypothetical protein IPP72_18100 [Chitinophagaceae bacterium]|nr:hypothetical protein [Chitinophagaceae bacterium]